MSTPEFYSQFATTREGMVRMLHDVGPGDSAVLIVQRNSTANANPTDIRAITTLPLLFVVGLLNQAAHLLATASVQPRQGEMPGDSQGVG